MTFYQWIRSDVPPHDIGLDQATGKPQVTFDIDCMKNPSSTFEEEIIGLLVAAGVGTFNATIFASSHSQLPSEEDDPAYLRLRCTGGVGSARVHATKDDLTAIRNAENPHPTMSLTAVAASYREARALAYAAWETLRPIRNTDVPVPVL